MAATLSATALSLLSSPRNLQLVPTDTLDVITGLAYLSNPQNGIEVDDGDIVLTFYANGGVASLRATVVLGVVTLVNNSSIKARNTAVWGGGATSNAFSALDLQTYSIVSATIYSQTNTSYIVSSVPTA